MCFVSDSNFDQILNKLSPLYFKKPRIEAKGTLNKINDFTVKLTSVVYGPVRSFRGILIEVSRACLCYSFILKFLLLFHGYIKFLVLE